MRTAHRATTLLQNVKPSLHNSRAEKRKRRCRRRMTHQLTRHIRNVTVDSILTFCNCVAYVCGDLHFSASELYRRGPYARLTATDRETLPSIKCTSQCDGRTQITILIIHPGEFYLIVPIPNCIIIQCRTLLYTLAIMRRLSIGLAACN